MKTLIFILAISALSFITCLAQSERTSPTNPAIEQKIIPVADYNPSEINNTKESELRKLRNSRFDMNKSFPPEVINQAKITERSFDNQPLKTISLSKMRPAFPISANIAIIMGEIIDGKAYISTDKTAVYSEFTLKIQKVLKSSPDFYIAKDNNIVLLRAGGGVKFPSGKVYYQKHHGYALPEVGRRYLMFLYMDKMTQSFTEIVGYEFKSGEVLPLDGAVESEGTGNWAEQYKYKGYKEKDFIDVVEKEIANFK